MSFPAEQGEGLPAELDWRVRREKTADEIFSVRGCIIEKTAQQDGESGEGF